MMCVTICIIHGRINFTSLYKLTYTFSVYLLHHISDELNYMWFNALMCYMVTVGWPTEKLKYSDIISVIVSLLWAPVSNYYFSQWVWGLFQTFWIVYFCLRQRCWCLTLLVGISFLSVRSLFNWYRFQYVM